MKETEIETNVFNTNWLDNFKNVFFFALENGRKYSMFFFFGDTVWDLKTFLVAFPNVTCSQGTGCELIECKCNQVRAV